MTRLIVTRRMENRTACRFYNKRDGIDLNEADPPMCGVNQITFADLRRRLTGLGGHNRGVRCSVALGGEIISKAGIRSSENDSAPTCPRDDLNAEFPVVIFELRLLPV
jgi:hypothetical protein